MTTAAQLPGAFAEPVAELLPAPTVSPSESGPTIPQPATHAHPRPTVASALEQALARARELVHSLSPQEIDDLVAGRSCLVCRPSADGSTGDDDGHAGHDDGADTGHDAGHDRATADCAPPTRRTRPAEPRPADQTGTADAPGGDGRRAHRATRRTPARAALGIDVTAVVESINSFDEPAEVIAYLDGLDARFTVPVLKEIARTLGPTVATTGRTKAQVKRDIVAGTAGFRSRSAAMSGGAWD